MTVGIQGKCGSCVTEIFLDSLHIITGLEGSNCVRVAKIVEADVGHAQFCHHQFEGPVSCLGCDAVSGLICKYQTRFFMRSFLNASQQVHGHDISCKTFPQG